MSGNNADTICWVLLFLLLILILMLVYLYRRLNRDTNDQYTVRKLVLDEGGLLDRVRSGIVAMETRLGIHLWPRPRPSSDDEEVIGDGQLAKDRDVETGQSLSDNRGEEVGAQGEGEHTDGGDDSEDDYSSMDGTDLRERAKLMKDVEDKDNDQEGEKRKEEEGEGEESEKGQEEDERKEEKNTESLGLLVNLQELSGSAIWSGEEKDENESTDLTAL